MKSWIVLNTLLIWLFLYCEAHVISPLYSSVCKKSGGSINCYQNDTWAFNMKTNSCYSVQRGKEPCGFFDGEKGCVDFCINSKIG